MVENFSKLALLLLKKLYCENMKPFFALSFELNFDFQKCFSFLQNSTGKVLY